MLHQLTDKWPYQYYKSYIIYNKESMLSRWSANKTLATTKRCGIAAELFNGTHKDNHAREMKIEGLKWNPTAYEWCHRIHHMDAVAGCFLSHYSLWKKSVETNEPILILEHDVEFQNKIEIPLEFGDFDGVINLGRPLWGDWFIKYFSIKEDDENRKSLFEIRDITQCKKPHAPNGVFDTDRVDFCDCERNFLIGAHSYIITPNAAKNLINKAKARGIDRADVFIDSETVQVADLIPFPSTQIKRFSLIDKGWTDVWQDSEYSLPTFKQEAVYHKEEIVLPCSPKWKGWLKFQKEHTDLYESLISAQDHTHRNLRFGKILFDKKEIVKGEKDGLFRDYFYDGKTVRCEGVIMDGEMHGEWKYFLADGTLEVIYTMKDGKLKKMDRQSWK